MSVITNYWPDPRFRDTGKLIMRNCNIAGHSDVFNPASSSFPGISLRATRDGDNWAERELRLDAGMTIIVACLSNGAATTAKASMNVWSGSTCLAVCPLNGGTSGEFTVPPSGTIKVCLRAPRTSGEVINIMNVFIGTKADYTALQGLVASGFLAGDLMPLS